MDRTVVVYEPSPAGHRLMYAGLVVDRILADGDRPVLATTRAAIDSAAFDEFLGRSADRLRLMVTDEPVGQCVALLNSIVDAVTPDLMVVPDGDRVAVALAMRGGWHRRADLTLLIMRPGPAGHGPASWLRNVLKRTLLLSLRRSSPRCRVLRLAPGTAPAVDDFAVRDPITYRATATQIDELRKEWGLDSDRYWYAVVGAIGPRKNVPLILAALADQPAGIGLLLAGRVEPGIVPADRAAATTFERDGGKLVVVDRFLSDAEVDAAVGAVDCVVLAHSNDGSSGLLGKAAAGGTTVVAAGASVLIAAVESLGLGATSGLTVRGLAAALRSAQRLSVEPHTDLGSPAEFATTLLARR
ncbi:MAG: glycosyltransferase family 1 protein [Actinomycetota bacterium]|nr:MAG: glycosyltransferase family 1 protein [Actinomycetota bacterium]